MLGLIPRGDWRKPAAHLAALALIGGVAACDGLGESGLDAELARVKALNGFGVLEQTRDKAEVVAQGAKLWIAASRGFCIAPESLEVSRRGIVAVIADCIDGEVKVTPTGTGATIELPPSFPGVTTVSVTGRRGLVETSAISDLASLEAFLETRQGRRLLGRSRDDEAIEIRDTRRIGDTLYVHVHDAGDDGLGIFAPDFWRAFLPIRDRLVLVTVNGFAARPLDEEDMTGFLAAQVVRLHEANGTLASAEEIALAKQVEGRFDAASGEVAVAELPASAGVAPKAVPQPRARPGGKKLAASGAAGDGHVARPSSRWAPVRAPRAPARPG
ncbi:MAG: hypothetical protein AAGE80_16920 [Pseudomonadota bacterium]